MMLKRTLPEQSATQLAVSDGVKTKRLRLVSASDDVADMIETIPKCSDLIINRSTLRQLSRRQSQHPAVSEKIMHGIKSNIAAFDAALLPEVWSILNACFGTLGRVDEEIHAAFLSLAVEQLESDSPVVRRSVIGFLGDYMPIDSNSKRITDMMTDQDGRIRLAAIRAMLKLFDRGAKLTMGLYSQSLRLSCDSCEQVRRLNLRLIAAMAMQEGEVEVHARDIEGHDKIRLVDDAFAWTCEALNDSQYQAAF